MPDIGGAQGFAKNSAAARPGIFRVSTLCQDYRVRIGAFPGTWPVGAALIRKAIGAMDVILHIGAHRCATTSFQHYLRANSDALRADGTGFWGPVRTRSGLLDGIMPVPGQRGQAARATRARARIAQRCAQANDAGVACLIVSDENMIGTMPANLRLGDLYSGAGERVARLAEAFDGRLTGIALNVRGLDAYWASALGYAVLRGRGVAPAGLTARLAAATRSWRDVIADIAAAAAGVALTVLPHEDFAGRPEAQLAALTGRPAPLRRARDRLNATPHLPALRALAGRDAARLPAGDGAWMPFDDTQRAALREAHADDMMWLTAGAGGLARLARPEIQNRDGVNPARTDLTRGRHHDRRHIEVARAGREGTARKAG